MGNSAGLIAHKPGFGSQNIRLAEMVMDFIQRGFKYYHRCYYKGGKKSAIEKWSLRVGINKILSAVGNKIFIGKEGFIHVIYEGDQNYDSIKEISEKVIQMCLALRGQAKPVRVLSDYSKIGHSDSGSRKAAFEELTKNTGREYDKVALFGKSIYYTVAANLIIKASGKGIKVKVFTNKKNAEKWLKKG